MGQTTSRPAKKRVTTKKRKVTRKSAPKRNTTTKKRKTTKRTTKKKTTTKKRSQKGGQRCKKGYILRKAYTQVRNGKKIRVKASCIKDRGAPGKGPKEIVLTKGDPLHVYGYYNVKSLSADKRHKALLKGVKAEGYLPLIRGLTARSNLMFRTDPKASKIFKNDQVWLSKQYKKYKATRAKK